MGKTDEEHCPEVANDINDEEDSTLLALHRKVAPFRIAIHRVSLSGFHEQIPDLTWRSYHVVCGIGTEGKDEDNYQNDDRMNIIYEKC